MKSSNDDHEHEVDDRVADVGKKSKPNSFNHCHDREPNGNEVVAGEEEECVLKLRKTFLINF
jgi:hypothetical protein